ncbi:MAG: ShlB/FhaC/HecB family hemolysin secretion/activation protein [Burkholderiales bacterium]|nr:ShlB/FhaC/HecB family hemolysin secretion/activation protein [Burkholderiales bacterium]
MKKIPVVFTCALLALPGVPDARAQGATEARFAVTAYAVEGDNPLAPGETQSILAPFAGEAVTIDRLQAAAGALEAALKDRGYGFLRVVVPPQDAQGVITLRVLSFKLGAVNLAGNRRFDDANVRRSLPALKPGETPNLRGIARNQAQVNDHPAKQVSVTVQQGKAPDTVDAAVKVEEGDPLQFFATLGNSGTPASGMTRLGVGVSHTNLFNRDHQVTATYTTSPEQASNIRQYGFHYRAPLYALGGTLAAYYTFSDSNSGTVAQFFQVSGRGEFYGLRWTQRFAPVGAYSHLAEIGVEERLFDNNVSFNGVPISSDVRSRPLLLRYEGRFDGVDYVARGALELAHNLHGSGANDTASYVANRAGATPGWQAWRYTVDGSRALGAWVASVRLRGQASGDVLIPGEQFGIGGASLVRGLEEREGTGDRGYVATAELLTPLLAEGLRGLVFVDTGEARLRAAGGAAGAVQHASSAGVGVRWQWRKRLSLSADWATVLDGTGSTNKHDNRVHATLSMRF